MSRSRLAANSWEGTATYASSRTETPGRSPSCQDSSPWTTLRSTDRRPPYVWQLPCSLWLTLLRGRIGWLVSLQGVLSGEVIRPLGASPAGRYRLGRQTNGLPDSHTKELAWQASSSPSDSIL